MTSIRRADIEWKVAVSEGSTEVWKWTSGPSAMETSETHLEYSVECWIGRSYAMRAWARDVRVSVCCDQNEQRVLSQVVVSSSVLENDHLKKGGCIRRYQLQATNTRNLSRWWSYWSDLGDWTHPTPEGERCTTIRSQLSMSIHTFIAPSVSKYFGHSFVRFVKMMNLVLFGAFVRRLNA